ncbi:unnamed protein product [Linum trigynum]|uniref:Uncharacterized protein n=1 Tax=Linum trigynum TaxID=586398 RepID=A0AAV2C9T1_9ROSI
MLASLQHHPGVPLIVMVVVEGRADIESSLLLSIHIIVGKVLPAVENAISSPSSSSSSIVLLLSIVVLVMVGRHLHQSMNDENAKRNEGEKVCLGSKSFKPPRRSSRHCLASRHLRHRHVQQR